MTKNILTHYAVMHANWKKEFALLKQLHQEEEQKLLNEHQSQKTALNNEKTAKIKQQKTDHDNRSNAIMNAINHHEQHVPKRVRWMLLLERDNGYYYWEENRLNQELESVKNSLNHEIDQINQEYANQYAALEYNQKEELVQLQSKNHNDLQDFINEKNELSHQLEDKRQQLENRFSHYPQVCDNSEPIEYISLGTLGCSYAKWNESESSTVYLPWLVSTKVTKGLIISGNQQLWEWTNTWIFQQLNAYPAGLMRLTFIDSKLLGRPFSRWLELGDSSAKLLGVKIWTEVQEIAKLLSELKEHIVRVTQRLLRHEFADLHDYNAANPASQEPMRLIVIYQAEGWRDDITDLIQQLFLNGPRCGVIPMIISESDEISIPSYLENHPHDTLCIDADHSLTGSFTGLPRHSKQTWLPNGDVMKQFTPSRLREIAEQATLRSTVSVDYECMLRDADIDETNEFQRSTTNGMYIPIGRSETGALQQIELGTSVGHSHILVAGRTGMGKSTLLHSIIVTACRMYNPQELLVYLLDFKHGTEFMPYAANKLPHARVVSVESDREFGISVLQFLETEIKRRSNILKSSGSQSIDEYRRQTGCVLPRMLLIIDEFQLLFNGQDLLADKASQLLEHLIRQGRSFGLHIILATQALSAGWSLSANALSQISIRIALACDERVSRQVLGEENKAAKQLSRPGEAIYNDQNGQVFGNHRFQAVHFRGEQLSDQVQRIASFHEGSQTACTIYDGSEPPDGPSHIAQHTFPTHGDIELLLGGSLEMGRNALICLQQRHGQNVMIFAEKPELRVRQAQSVLACLERQSIQAMLIDASPERAGISKDLRIPQKTEFFTSVDAYSAITRLRENFEHIAQENYPLIRQVVVIHAPNLLSDLRIDPLLAMGRTVDQTVATDFEWLLRHGPTLGLHFVLISERPSTFFYAIDPRAKLLDLFDHRAGTRMPEDDARRIFPDAKASKLSDEHAIMYQRHANECLKFRPFAWCP